MTPDPSVLASVSNNRCPVSSRLRHARAELKQRPDALLPSLNVTGSGCPYQSLRHLYLRLAQREHGQTPHVRALTTDVVES